MTSLDLDPLFVKALKLLHSRSKDSTDQLREMVDDAIAQRRAYLKGMDLEKKPKQEDDPVKKRETEKKQFEKVKQDLSDLSQETPAKKPRTHSPSPDKTSSSKDKEQDREKEREKEKAKKEKEARDKRETEKKEKIRLEREKEKDKEREKEKEKERERKKKEEFKPVEDSDSDEGMDADDIAFGLGIACVVCRQFDVTSNNKLIECQECHSLYHQECHKPPVIEQDVNDPRFVWYCSRCAKNLKKMVQSKPAKPKPVVSQSVTAFTKETTSLLKPSKMETSSSLLFRRAEPKVSSSKESVTALGSKPLSGLASLAANLSGKGGNDANRPHSSKLDPSKLNRPDPFKSLLAIKSDPTDRPLAIGVSLLKTNPKPSLDAAKNSLKPVLTTKTSQGGSLAAVTADKRLQQMKKKAAAKMQEKRAR